MLEATKQAAYDAFIRGVEIPAIASQLNADADEVTNWIADGLTETGVGDEDQEPARKAAGDSLRAIKRNLWASMQAAEHKAPYGSALAVIEQRLLKIDGRCGARTRQGVDRFCMRYPVPDRTRCRLHGGATLLAGPNHPSWRTGQYSRTPPVPITVEETKSAARADRSRHHAR